MKARGLLTTGEVAVHCRVSYETVNQWIKGGKLKAYTTPGRHHRIAREDFRAFLAEHHLPPLEEPHADQPRILVVDDDPGVVQLIAKCFRRANECEVATAVDGFEAGLQLAAFKPDLIILDLFIPNLDGFKVCQLIRGNAETRHLAILVVTAFPSQENVRKALECGADFCLAKPFRIHVLRQKVNELLQGETASRASRTA